MNVHREGSGPPLVLIHGIGHHWQAWLPVLPLLRDCFDVLAVDSPGFGRSAPLPEGVTPDVDAYADAFVAWFSEMGLERPHVAGNSMGGALALELAQRGAVASATAVSPAGFWNDRERAFCQLSLRPLADTPAALKPVLRGLARTAVGRTMVGGQLFSRPWKVPADEFVSVLDDAWAAPAFDAALRAFDGYAFEGAAPEVPVTVAWGSRDRLLLFGPQSRRAQERLPHARHVTLDGLGHVPMTDDPGVVANVLRVGAGR